MSIGRQPGTQPANHRAIELFLRHVWLVYTVFFIIGPLEKSTTRSWVMMGVAFVLFFTFYFGAGYARSRSTRLIMLGSLLLLGILYTPLNEGACGIFVFTAAGMPYLIPPGRLVKWLLLALAGILLAETLFFHINIWATSFSILFTPVVGLINYASVQKRAADAKLRMAHEEIEHLAKLAERERIARDMHDVLGHALSVVVLKSELAGCILEQDPARARREIADVEETARKALTEVREAIRGYRAEGLAAEIERAHRTLDSAGIALTCVSAPPALAPAEETVLSLIVREAVTNIVRHAKASRCSMEFAGADGSASVIVEDDGCGGARPDGNGLRGMRERVEALGGRFSVASTQGTRLLVEIPIRT